MSRPLAFVTRTVAARGRECGRCTRPIPKRTEHLVVAGDPICGRCVEPEEAARATGGRGEQGVLDLGEAS